MPDITMCRGKSCDCREKCYRYMAVPFRFWQAYFVGPKKKGENCEHFWPLEKATGPLRKETENG